MKVSYKWLETYFEKTPPAPEKIAELLTAHAFEIESLEKVGTDTVFDVKVLPDRAHDCLSHMGIAREVSVLSGAPLKKEKISPKKLDVPESNLFRAEVADQKLCRRFSALVIEGIEVKDSPLWLVERLEALGQRSINNIVDATNYVMFAVGQPLHAYDRELLTDSGGSSKLGVRLAHDGETLTALDGKEYTLTTENLIIVDGNTDNALGIAGVKGGKATEITEKTKNIILEAANFDPISVRKTAKKLGLRTDASVRFENEITPELTVVALREVADLILEIASGEKTQVEGSFDFYPERSSWKYLIGVSTKEVNDVLGTSLNDKELESTLNKTGFSFEVVIPEDVIRATIPTLLGKKYKSPSTMRHDAPEFFSCSSLISYLYTLAGIWMPSISIDKYVYGEVIEEKDVRFGDLIFALTPGGSMYVESKEWMKGTSVPEGIDHVGMMLSSEEVLHTSRHNHNPEGVRVESLQDFLKNHELRGFRRIPALSDKPRFVVTIPPERLDLRLKEDLVEEIGRIYGYKNISPKEISIPQSAPDIEKLSHYISRTRTAFVNAGFSEVYTYAFSSEGEEELLNPIAGDKRFLRSTLSKNLSQVIEKNTHNADLLGLSEIKVFEIGTVFTRGREFMTLSFGSSKKDYLKEIEGLISQTFGKNMPFEKKGNVYEGDFSEFVSGLATPTEPTLYTANDTELRFKPYSPYPCIVRDIAVFVPEGSPENAVLNLVTKESGELLLKTRLFDVFTKTFPDGTKKTSYAYRLIFQSFERTLTDEEVNAIMEKVTNLLNAEEGWQVR